MTVSSVLLSIVLDLLRAVLVPVTAVLTTVGPLMLGFGVMTECTNTTSECTAPQVILVAGWVAQGVLAVVAVSLWVPLVAGLLSERRLAVLMAAVPVVALVVFVGTGWAASNAYCLDTQVSRDYCDVRL